MGVPQGWRLRKQRYLLMGGICLNCGHKLFPPRDVCPECGGASAEARPPLRTAVKCSLTSFFVESLFRLV